MPPTCRTCRSPKRRAIDAALVAGTPSRDIAARFGTSKSALARHRLHAAETVVKAAERREEDLGDGLLGQMRSVQARTLKLLDDAEKARDGRLRAAAIREVRENVLLLSRFTGELRDTAPQVAVIVLRWGDDVAMGAPALPAAPIEAGLVKAAGEPTS
jgi:hypothetical protein